jgi:hypothetical protein
MKKDDRAAFLGQIFGGVAHLASGVARLNKSIQFLLASFIQDLATSASCDLMPLQRSLFPPFGRRWVGQGFSDRLSLALVT